MGFTDSNDGDDEGWVLMIVLVWRGDFSVNTFIVTFQTATRHVLRFRVESDVSS